jgi:hypothetical protein
MTAAIKSSQIITYELLNKHKRRSHIRAMLLQTLNQHAEKKASQPARLTKVTTQ